MEIILNRGENVSHVTEINFVARHENIFIIDNHLTAFWCWCKLDTNNSYKLLHVDRHYDLVPYHQTDEIVHNIDWSNTTLENIPNIRKNVGGFNIQLLRWDNYINLFHEFKPNLISYTVFVTQKEGSFHYDGHNYQEKDILELFDLIYEGDEKWIFNIDIDFFFTVIGDNRISLYTDEFINMFGKLLADESRNAAQIIICLSPECCGGWNESKRVANIILLHFGQRI